MGVHVVRPACELRPLAPPTQVELRLQGTGKQPLWPGSERAAKRHQKSYRLGRTLSGTDFCPGLDRAQYAFFLNTNPTLLVDKTGIIPVSGNSN